MAAAERGVWEYAGRWALVTGASSGIGEEFARRLARLRMKLVLSARREERLRGLAAELHGAHGTEAVVIPADLAEPGAARGLWTEAAAGRELHLVVNNAGFGLKGRFDALSLERQAEMVRLNCSALMELTHLALPGMRARGAGGIVNVASVAAFQPIPELAVYAASKAFVLSLTQAVAEEQRGTGVRVLALCPGPVATGFQDVAGTQVSERTPGIMTAEEVVAATLRTLETGGDTVVPGTLNRLGTVAGRMLPRSLVVRAAKTILKKMR